MHHWGHFSSGGEGCYPRYPNPGRFFLHPCGFLTKRGMLALEMFSPLAIFARGLNATVKNRNNEGRQKLLTLSHEARTGSQDPFRLVMIDDGRAACVLS